MEARGEDDEQRSGKKGPEVRFVTLPFFERRMEEVKERGVECETTLLGPCKALDEVRFLFSSILTNPQFKTQEIWEAYQRYLSPLLIAPISPVKSADPHRSNVSSHSRCVLC